MTDPDDRARFREFVRRAHPDAGGDPDEFVAGLAEFRRPRAADRGDPTRPHRRDDVPVDDSRFDAPVFAHHRPRGIGRVVAAVRRWRDRRGRPPRVL